MGSLGDPFFSIEAVGGSTVTSKSFTIAWQQQKEKGAIARALSVFRVTELSCGGGVQHGLGLSHQGGKAGWVVHGDVGEHLAV